MDELHAAERNRERGILIAGNTRLDRCLGRLSRFGWNGALRIWRRLAVLLFAHAIRPAYSLPYFTQPRTRAMDPFFERVPAPARVGVHEDLITPGPERREEPSGRSPRGPRPAGPPLEWRGSSAEGPAMPQGREEVAPDEALRGPAKQFPRIVEALAIQVDPVRDQAVAARQIFSSSAPLPHPSSSTFPASRSTALEARLTIGWMQNVHPVPRGEAVVAMVPVGPGRDDLDGVVEAAPEAQRTGHHRPRPRRGGGDRPVGASSGRASPARRTTYSVGWRPCGWRP